MGKLLEAVKSGDERRILEELRDNVAATLEDECSPRDKAALSKRLMEICRELKALPSEEDINPVDEMAAFVAEYDEYEDPRFEDDDG